ncbi:hypothetical protein HAX54_033185 [Datura stramonium]|uniref:Uncharacterized protein n=1 Tax=Datura stramonium TaxID=4076 RepID=A0ABS8VC24_DATST|nr:hypothetical protein [Datura stramonium]
MPILRRRKSLGGGIGKNGGVCHDGGNCRESVFRCCRREVCLNSVMEVDRALLVDSVSGLDHTEVDVEGPCKASDQEKRKASAVNNIMSVLANYSQLRETDWSVTRDAVNRTSLLSASLNISFELTSHLPDMPIVYASDAPLKLTGSILVAACFLSEKMEPHSGIFFTFLELNKPGKHNLDCFYVLLLVEKLSPTCANPLYFCPFGCIGCVLRWHSDRKIPARLRETRAKFEMRQRSVVAAVKVAVRGWSRASTPSS